VAPLEDNAIRRCTEVQRLIAQLRFEGPNLGVVQIRSMPAKEVRAARMENVNASLGGAQTQRRRTAKLKRQRLIEATEGAMERRDGAPL